MTHKNITFKHFISLILALVLFISSGLPVSMNVLAANESSGTSSGLSAFDKAAAAESIAADINAETNNRESSEKDKKIDPFSFIFGFLVPVIAVVTFLIFFIVTRSARFKKRRAETKKQAAGCKIHDNNIDQ